jgi:hypothetical protein
MDYRTGKEPHKVVYLGGMHHYVPPHYEEWRNSYGDDLIDYVTLCNDTGIDFRDKVEDAHKFEPSGKVVCDECAKDFEHKVKLGFIKLPR